MLTRDEAKKIFDSCGNAFIYVSGCDGCANYAKVFQRAMDTIRELTEKPKKENNDISEILQVLRKFLSCIAPTYEITFKGHGGNMKELLEAEKIINRLLEKVGKESTEHPKSKVKVGDMYRDGLGNYETVRDVLNDYFHTEEDFSYDFNGNFLGDTSDEETRANYNLDLSKRYKIVEDTDAD